MATFGFVKKTMKENSFEETAAFPLTEDEIKEALERCARNSRGGHQEHSRLLLSDAIGVSAK